MNNFEHNKNVEDLLKDVATLQLAWLAEIIGVIENTEMGQLVIAKNSDRRLYAILHPTSDEYLQRLRALLELADEYTVMVWQTLIRLSLAIIKYSDYIGECRDNGRISCGAADDLVRELWENTWLEITNVFA